MAQVTLIESMNDGWPLGKGFQFLGTMFESRKMTSTLPKSSTTVKEAMFQHSY